MNGLVKKIMEHAAEHHAVAMLQEISLNDNLSEEYERFLQQRLYYRFLGELEAYHASLSHEEDLKV